MAAIRSSKNRRIGGWKYKDSYRWVDFDEMASREIDDKLRSGLKSATNNRIDFALTQGPFFSQSMNKGTYWIVAILDTNKTKIVSIKQRNSMTQNLRDIKRDPEFKFLPSPSYAAISSSHPVPNKPKAVLFTMNSRSGNLAPSMDGINV